MDDTPVLIVRSVAGKLACLALFSSSGEYIGRIHGIEYPDFDTQSQMTGTMRITVDVSPIRVVTLDPFTNARA